MNRDELESRWDKSFGWSAWFARILVRNAASWNWNWLIRGISGDVLNGVSGVIRQVNEEGAPGLGSDSTTLPVAVARRRGPEHACG